MNIREAILKTADLFERKPEAFDFMSTNVPPDCGTPGCAIGRMMYFMGIKRKLNYGLDAFCRDHLGVEEAPIFYRRMVALEGPRWVCSAQVCARALRLYADKYHPEQKALTIYRPGADIVRDFLQEQAA